MSSADEKTELKGGHAPAVKAGGMRITQNKSPKEEAKPTKDAKPEGELDDAVNEALKVSTSPPKSTTVSGAPVRGFADFPAEAVQSFHDKPAPTHDSRQAHSKPNIIQQPRK